MSDDYFSTWNPSGPNGIISLNNINNPANPNSAYQQIMRLQGAIEAPLPQSEASVGAGDSAFLVIVAVVLVALSAWLASQCVK